MSEYINTNMASIMAQSNLSKSQTSLSSSLERLSSGLRINSAADDAAGYAIASRMTSQINGLNQAARNANDGISLAQTAAGALSSISDNLQTMRSLAVQASNATATASDRVSINNEIQQLSAEIQRVATTTTFNGTNLLDGSFNTQAFQIGANQGNTIIINSIANMQTSQLGNSGTSYQASLTGGITTAALNAGDLTLNGVQVGASQHGEAFGQNAGSAFAIAAAINAVSGYSSVTATANAPSLIGVAPTVFTAIAANTFSINGVNVGAVAAGGDAAGQGANAAAAINLISSQTGVTATADPVSGALNMTAADGRDINITINGLGTVGAIGVVGSALNNAFLLDSRLGLTIAQTGPQGIPPTPGVTVGTAASAPTAAGGTIADGTFAVNGVSVGTITLNSAIAQSLGSAQAINSTFTVPAAAAGTVVSGLQVNGVNVATYTATGVANADAAILAGNINAAGGSVTVVGNVITNTSATNKYSVSGTALDAGTAAANVAALGNATGLSGKLGTQASGGAAENGIAIAAAITAALASAPGGGTATADAAGVVTLNSATIITMLGIAASNAIATANQTALINATGFSAAQVGNQAAAATGVTTSGTVSLSSTSPNGIVIGGSLSASAGLTDGQTTAGLSTTVFSIASLNVLNADDAANAITTIDGALNIVNNTAATLGAYQNRFQSAANNTQTAVINLTASRSRIQDTDFAATTGMLTRSQILQQAGIAMLAQANAISKGVMALLR